MTRSLQGSHCNHEQTRNDYDTSPKKLGTRQSQNTPICVAYKYALSVQRVARVVNDDDMTCSSYPNSFVMSSTFVSYTLNGLDIGLVSLLS